MVPKRSEERHQKDLSFSTRCHADETGIPGQFLQCGRRGLKQQILDCLLVRTGHRSQFGRQGKGHQKITEAVYVIRSESAEYIRHFDHDTATDRRLSGRQSQIDWATFHLDAGHKYSYTCE